MSVGDVSDDELLSGIGSGRAGEYVFVFIQALRKGYRWMDWGKAGCECH